LIIDVIAAKIERGFRNVVLDVLGIPDLESPSAMKLSGE